MREPGYANPRAGWTPAGRRKVTRKSHYRRPFFAAPVAARDAEGVEGAAHAQSLMHSGKSFWSDDVKEPHRDVGRNPTLQEACEESAMGGLLTGGFRSDWHQADASVFFFDPENEGFFAVKAYEPTIERRDSERIPTL